MKDIDKKQLDNALNEFTESYESFDIDCGTIQLHDGRIAQVMTRVETNRDKWFVNKVRFNKKDEQR